MAKAFVPNFEFDTLGEDLVLTFQVLFFGGGLRDLSIVSVTILGTDTLAQVKQKLVNAISVEATNLGYSVSATDIILPVFQKGG